MNRNGPLQARELLFVGGIAAWGSVGLLLVQLVVYMIWPPVHTVSELFDLLHRSPAVGLLSLDALYLVNNVLVLLFYLGLAALLWPVSQARVVLIVVLGTLQMGSYYASNPAVEMLVLARRHADAAGESERVMYRAAGEAVLTAWKGTAFLVYYVLGAAVLLILTTLIRRSRQLGPRTWWWALAAGVLMLVPSTFGTVGIAFAIASLAPWSVLCLVAGRHLVRLAGDDSEPAPA